MLSTAADITPNFMNITLDLCALKHEDFIIPDGGKNHILSHFHGFIKIFFLKLWNENLKLKKVWLELTSGAYCLFCLSGIKWITFSEVVTLLQTQFDTQIFLWRTLLLRSRYKEKIFLKLIVKNRYAYNQIQSSPKLFLHSPVKFNTSSTYWHFLPSSICAIYYRIRATLWRQCYLSNRSWYIKKKQSVIKCGRHYL